MVETTQLGSDERFALSVREQQSFDEIVERFDIGLDPELIEDVNACLHINEQLNHTDLQADRIAELKQARDELLVEFLERPQEAYLAEVLNYARLCQNRSISETDYLGNTVTEFVTTNHARQEPDQYFRITEHVNGKVSVMTEVPLRGDMYETEEPFFIRADSEGGLSIEQRLWRRGQYVYQPLELGSGSLGEDRLRRFFMFSTEAVHLAYTRQPEQRAEIDAAAKRLLLTKKSAH
jgi:hypothetical protein